MVHTTRSKIRVMGLRQGNRRGYRRQHGKSHKSIRFDYVNLHPPGDSCDTDEMASRGPRSAVGSLRQGAPIFCPSGSKGTARSPPDRRNAMPGAAFGATDYARNCMKCNSRSSQEIYLPQLNSIDIPAIQ